MQPEDSKRRLLPVGRKQREHVLEAVSRVPEPGEAGALAVRVKQVRAVTTRPPSCLLRRSLFLWFRVYACGTDGDEHGRVDIRVPIPLPLVGAFFRRRLTPGQALRLVELAHGQTSGRHAVTAYLDSCMAVELFRAEGCEPGEHGIVVVGFD